MKNVKRILAVTLSVLFILCAFTACAASPEKKLIGSWRDSTGIAGYEFMEEGKCVITFADVNVPIFNVNLNNKVDGVYTVQEREDGNNYVTITYTFYSKSITKDYMFVVDESSLTLTDTSDGTVTVLIAYSDQSDTTVATSSEAAQ